MAETDNRLVILSPSDTVAVARCAIKAETELLLDGRIVKLERAVTMGHKIARTPMMPGDKVLKYGVSIGSATSAIAAGEHVHLHNLESDYTPTYALTEEGEVA